MSLSLPKPITDAVSGADPSWKPILLAGLEAMSQANPNYFPALIDEPFLPTNGRMFAAFAQPLDNVKNILVGEGPYPREQSATGVCFMDGAVESLWSEKGLSKPVNRATSLRNFMKMLLVAEGYLSIEQTTGDAMAGVAAKATASNSPFIQTLQELQENLTRHGFLLLNAALVFRPTMPPIKEAKAWQPFLQTVLNALADHAEQKGRAAPTLVLWGKVAEQLDALSSYKRFPKVIAEHPYNLSFIGNATMQKFFGPMHLLLKPDRASSEFMAGQMRS